MELLPTSLRISILFIVLCQTSNLHNFVTIPRPCYINRILPIQGGSDKSGPLSKLLNCIKNMSFLFFLSSQTGSAVCRSVNKKKKTHSSKDEARGRYKSRDCLRASRRTYHKEIMSYGNTKRALFTMLQAF
jgi:hypothetical protein